MKSIDLKKYYIFEDYMQKAGFHVAKFNHRHSR